MSVMVEFVNVPKGTNRIVGPFEYVQMTYGELTGASVDGDAFIKELAHMSGGYWLDEGGDFWTDFIITSK